MNHRLQPHLVIINSASSPLHHEYAETLDPDPSSCSLPPTSTPKPSAPPGLTSSVLQFDTYDHNYTSMQMSNANAFSPPRTSPGRSPPNQSRMVSPGEGVYGDYPINQPYSAGYGGEQGLPGSGGKPAAAQALNFSSARAQPQLMKHTGPDVVL